MQKRHWFAATGLLVVIVVGAILFGVHAIRAGREPTVTVFRGPACACCTEYMSYLEQNGFHVVAEVVDSAELQEVRRRFGVPDTLRGCHTALVGGRVIEGRVPADVLHRFLAQAGPDRGIAAVVPPPGAADTAAQLVVFGGPSGPRAWRP